MSTSQPHDEDLGKLRDALSELDAQVVELAARRQELVGRISKVKTKCGKGTRDFAQERVVIQNARKRAADLGSSPSLAEELMKTLIRHSLLLQEQDRIHASGEGTGSRVLIIGGAGRMGQWFSRFLSSQGFMVEVADPVGAAIGLQCHPDYREVEHDHDMIIVAAPLRQTNEILLELAKNPPRGIVFDIGSLKSPVRDGLKALRAAGGRVTSIHPMFGPGTELLSGRHVVFVDVGDRASTDKVKALFAATMAKSIDLDLESHDRLIAYVLGASHALNLAFLSALADSGETASSLAHLSSTTFDAQMGVARQVSRENPSLYYEIQALNDYGTESLAALLLAIERVRSVVRARDREGFEQLMARCRAYSDSLAANEGDG